jgi:hypothetical protein
VPYRSAFCGLILWPTCYGCTTAQPNTDGIKLEISCINSGKQVDAKYTLRFKKISLVHAGHQPTATDSRSRTVPVEPFWTWGYGRFLTVEGFQAGTEPQAGVPGETQGRWLAKAVGVANKD